MATRLESCLSKTAHPDSGALYRGADTYMLYGFWTAET